MIQTPVIVTFANQKGGVGKTTLCITFANYLVTKGARVVVIDCDFQHSIMKCRKADIRKYGEQEMPYEVWAYEANDKAMMTSLMEKLHNDPEIDVVLMDSPGSLKAEGLIPMFVNSDIIIVPFHYDLVTVPSTASFLMFVDRLKKAVGERMKARLFIIPNLNDGRIGKRSGTAYLGQCKGYLLQLWVCYSKDSQTCGYGTFQYHGSTGYAGRYRYTSL
ncbi:ParA family protein [Phocaeicola vulgatus]|nr:ParA family protein [Phocaeicola vulgatus]